MTKKIASLVVYGTAPWGSAMPVLRIVGPAQWAGISVIYGNDGPDVDPAKVSQADIVVIQRDFPRFALALGEILRNAREQNKPVIYELDDLLIELPEEHISYSDLSMVQLPMIWAMVEADAITVSTPYLQDYLRDFNPNTWLLPNYLNEELWALQAPLESGLGREPIVIGYMGGQTHQADLVCVQPALERILDRYATQIKMHFWGGEPPGALHSHPQVSWTPLDMQDYAEFARYFGEQRCDIFISPLKDNHFNRAKSAIKFLEYSALGVPGVYSRILPYVSVVTDGVNGLLASDDEWFACLQKLIENADLRLEMGRSAQSLVKRSYLLSQHVSLWETTYLQAKRLVHERERAYFEKLRLISKAAQQMQDSYARLDREKVAFAEGVILKKTELEDIYQSQSWRLATRIQRLRERFAPLGSRREKLLDKLRGIR